MSCAEIVPFGSLRCILSAFPLRRVRCLFLRKDGLRSLFDLHLRVYTKAAISEHVFRLCTIWMLHDLQHGL